MKPDKTVTSAPPPQPPAPEADASVDFRPPPHPAHMPGHRASRPKRAKVPDQPNLHQSTPTKDDPFSCPPQIYDPDANFIVDSAQNEISELLPPKPDTPPPTT